MLGTASFYKNTPKIMPKTSRSKTAPTRSESPVTKKRRVRQNGGILVENGQFESVDWTPKVVVTKLATSASLDGCGQCIDAVAKNDTKKKVVNSVNGRVTLGNDIKSSRASTRIRSMRTTAVKKLEEMKIKEEEKEPALPGNQISNDYDDDDSDHEARKGGMSEYEKKRLQNIEENAKFLAALGISKTKATMSRNGTSALGLKRKKRISKKVNYGRRPPSLRIRRMDPEGVTLPEPPAPEPSAEELRRERKPSGPFDMLPVNINEEDSKENLEKPLFKSLSGLSKSPKVQKTSTYTKDLDEFTQTLQRMTLTSERIAKVTKDRVMSVAVHPSSAKIIVCAGDKWGRVGVWDVGSKAGDDGVYLFEPHSRPVNCLQFAPADPTKLFSCSYDGTVRCADFEKGVFDKIYATDVEEDIFCSHFDFLSPDGKKLLVSQNQQQGYIQIVDSRLECKTSTPGFFLHKRYIKTVHVHPTSPERFVTASNDNTVALWDLRMLKKHGKCQSLSTFTHGKSVSAAYFSPITGNKVVTTSYDDRIRILQVEENNDLEVERIIRQNNHTGRWLTSFRTVWHPRREDVILVGSMDRPRSVKVFNIEGHLLHNFQDDLLGSVCSINAWHPTLDVIVGANSSGRLHVFM